MNPNIFKTKGEAQTFSAKNEMANNGKGISVGLEEA